jgi:methionyl-tRNA formyltransferase
VKIFFAGSPPFATPILEALLASRHAVVGVLTQPSRPQGRGRKSQPSEVEILAAEAGVAVTAAENANDPEIVARVSGAAPDALVVASFGQLLRDPLLAAARHGALNVHASILPRHRGAAPIAYALLLGDAETGVTIQRMVRKLDAGPICGIARTPIAPRETAGELTARLAHMGGILLVEALGEIEAGRARFTPQDESLVTLAPKLKKDDGRIDWLRSAREIELRVRAMTPWPGATATLVRSRILQPSKGGEPNAGEAIGIRILESHAKESVAPPEAPGSILGLPAEQGGTPPPSLGVATSDGVLVIERLQAEGAKPMDAQAFLRGQRLNAGAHLLSSRIP